MSRDKRRFFLLMAFLTLCVGIAREYSMRMERREKAEDFARSYIRLIQANDLQNAYHQATSKRFRKIFTFEKYVSDYSLAFRKVGDLKSWKTIGWEEPGVKRDYYTLDCAATYQRDTGNLRFTLDLEDGKYRLAGFVVYSDNWEKLREVGEN